MQQQMRQHHQHQLNMLLFIGGLAAVYFAWALKDQRPDQSEQQFMDRNSSLAWLYGGAIAIILFMKYLVQQNRFEALYPNPQVATAAEALRTVREREAEQRTPQNESSGVGDVANTSATSGIG